MVYGHTLLHRAFEASLDYETLPQIKRLGIAVGCLSCIDPQHRITCTHTHAHAHETNTTPLLNSLEGKRSYD